jgi:hypothetical protein
MDNEVDLYAIHNTLQLFGEEKALVSVTEAQNFLREKIYEMLNKDFNGLVNLLYRIDVYESKAKNCFGKSNKEIADCLADLIWERQLEKAKRRYNS